MTLQDLKDVYKTELSAIYDAGEITELFAVFTT